MIFSLSNHLHSPRSIPSISSSHPPPPSPSVEVPLLLLSVSPPRSSSWPSSAISHILCSPKKCNYVVPLPRLRCVTESAEETSWSDEETLNGEGEPNEWRRNGKRSSDVALADSQKSNTYTTDSLSLGIREPVYEVIEVKSDGVLSTRRINRRQLLKSSGLRPRDVRSVDPSLWMTNSMPSLLVRENAILLNLGTLRAIAMPERVFIFDYNRKGGKAFLDHLLPRLNPKNMNGAPSMPFELEVVALLEVLPYRLTADVLEELRLSKQTLAEANPIVTGGGARIQLGQ